jgi:drug/metabolite transporter (DMT)-like permease
MGPAFALLTALLWALAVVFFKKSVGFVAPFALNFFKNCVSLILLALTTWILGQVHSVPARDLAIMLASGAIGIGLSDTLYFMALERLGASRTALFDCFYSPFVIVFSVFMLAERLSPLALAGGLLILASVLVSSKPGFGATLPPRQLWSGGALGGLAMATVAFAVVLVKPVLAAYSAAWVSTIRMCGGIAILVLMLPLHEDRKSVYAAFRPQPGFKWMLLGTLVGSYLSLMSWIAGFKYSSAGTAALLNQTSTVLIVLLAAWLLHEPLTRLKLLAVGMAFAGAAMVLKSM